MWRMDVSDTELAVKDNKINPLVAVGSYASQTNHSIKINGEVNGWLLIATRTGKAHSMMGTFPALMQLYNGWT